jgi:hypothetical protein
MHCVGKMWRFLVLNQTAHVVTSDSDALNIQHLNNPNYYAFENAFPSSWTVCKYYYTDCAQFFGRRTPYLM